MATTLINPNQWEGMVHEASRRGRYLLDELASTIDNWQDLLNTSQFALLDCHRVPLSSTRQLQHVSTMGYSIPLARHGGTFATILSPYPLDHVVKTQAFQNLVLKLALTLADLNEWSETEAERRGEKLRLVEEYGMTPEVIKLLSLCGLQDRRPRVLVAFETAMDTPFQNMEVLRRFVIAKVWRYQYEFPWIAYRPDGILAFLPDTCIDDSMNRVKESMGQWHRTQPKFPIRAYVNFMPDLMQLPETLRETQTLMQFAAHYNLSGVVNQTVDRHYAKVLAEMSPETLDELVRTTLGPLLHPDNLVILQTLQQYLATGQSLAKTGQILYVHPNTVLYRIGHAKKLLGIDLKSTEQLTNIWIALQGYALLSSKNRSISP